MVKVSASLLKVISFVIEGLDLTLRQTRNTLLLRNLKRIVRVDHYFIDEILLCDLAVKLV